jgi:hypothetical protein
MDLIKMNKTQLLETFEKHSIPLPEGIDAEKGPTNKELIAAIEAYNAENASETDPAPLPKREADKKPEVFSKAAQFKADMTRAERVIVTDTQRFQSLDEDAPISWPVSFSNGIISEGMLVSLSGDPQYIPRCLIAVLKGVELQEWTQEGDSARDIRKIKRKRFVVMPVEGMTDAEIDAQKKRELARAGQ